MRQRSRKLVRSLERILVWIWKEHTLSSRERPLREKSSIEAISRGHRRTHRKAGAETSWSNKTSRNLDQAAGQATRGKGEENREAHRIQLAGGNEGDTGLRAKVGAQLEKRQLIGGTRYRVIWMFLGKSSRPKTEKKKKDSRMDRTWFCRTVLLEESDELLWEGPFLQGRRKGTIAERGDGGGAAVILE